MESLTYKLGLQAPYVIYMYHNTLVIEVINQLSKQGWAQPCMKFMEG